jgi:5-methylcytosine-specific restriction endonuclease McrA
MGSGRVFIRDEHAMKNKSDMAVDYAEYIQTYHWLQVAEETRMHRPHCEVCGMNRQWSRYFWGVDLNVHHKTYENLGNEKPEDLEVLCVRCHSERHNLKPPPIFSAPKWTPEWRTLSERFAFPKAKKIIIRQHCLNCDKERTLYTWDMREVEREWVCEECRW